MNFVLLAACSALIGFALVNATLSLLVEILWSFGGVRSRFRSGSRLLFLRIAPAAFSTTVVALALVPAFLVHEPRPSAERVNLWLLLAAAPGLLILGGAARRALGAWRATRTTIRVWRRRGQRIELAGWNGSAFRVAARSACPGVFVTGYHRPTLFLAGSIESACTGPELAAIVAHERAHTRARDNLKRFAMRCVPDVLALMPAAAAIERSWDQAVEDEADAEAVCSRGTDRFALASAIVKVSRLVCATPPSWGTSSFLPGGPIARRVRRLTAAGRSMARSAGRGRWIPWLTLALPAIAFAFPDLSLRLHRVTEAVVQLLTRL